MSLEKWLEFGWIKPHKTSKQEINSLFEMIERDLKDADYLDQCRRLRNKVEYDMIGGATTEDIKDLIDFIEEFNFEVKQWLKATHKELLNK